MRARFSRLPFGRKLWLLNLVTLTLAWVLGVLLLGAYAWTAMRAELQRNSETVLGVLAQNTAPAALFDDAKGATEVLSALASDNEVLSAELVLNDGRRMARYRRAGSERTVSDRALAGNRAHFYARELHVVAPVEANGQALGRLHLYIDLLPTYGRLAVFLAVILATAVVALVVANGLQARLLRKLLGPVESLVGLMRRVSTTADYDQRAEVQAHDEIGELGQSFNAMMGQIQERDLALGRELAERRRAEAQLEYLAMHDPVTGLPNRHYFSHRAHHASLGEGAGGAGTALLYVDLDNFKQINDNFGHDCGDRLLVAVAERLSAMLRVNDLVVRFGGDEFVVQLNNIHSDRGALHVAEKLLKILAQPIRVDDHEFIVTCSVGIAMAPQHGNNVDELLQKADAAMYVAKANGKHGVQLWHAAISEQASERFSLEAGLRLALDNGEIEVEYQPIMRLADGALVGMEALARWRHPTRGFISPAEFIPVAEESGLILAIGLWVLETACTQVAAWHRQYGPLFLAVNVSASQFRDPAFARSVQAVCQRTQYPPGQLELEVTESIVMRETAQAIHIMQTLAELGLGFALDDFGTGYSSLSYLKRFPLSKIKIDRSFVKDLPHDADDTAIVHAILALARSLDLRVVAEGIETAEQRAVLHGMGCALGQGYHFSRSLSAERFAQLLQDSRGPART